MEGNDKHGNKKNPEIVIVLTTCGKDEPDDNGIQEYQY